MAMLGDGAGPKRSAPRRPTAPARPAPPRERPASTTRPAADAARRATPSPELRFLHELLRLATTAQTWEELLETVVDGTRDALRAEVSSLYLLDRDGLNLPLAATNGLDRHQIGHAIVPFGEGITGRVAAMRQPMVIADIARGPALPVGPRHRPAPVRPLDAVGAADLARPGRRRAQRPDRDPPQLHRRGRRPAVRDRGPAGRDRREGPPPGRGRGAGRAARGAGPGARRS